MSYGSFYILLQKECIPSSDQIKSLPEQVCLCAPVKHCPWMRVPQRAVNKPYNSLSLTPNQIVCPFRVVYYCHYIPHVTKRICLIRQKSPIGKACREVSCQRGQRDPSIYTTVRWEISTLTKAWVKGQEFGHVLVTNCCMHSMQIDH